MQIEERSIQEGCKKVSVLGETLGSIRGCRITSQCSKLAWVQDDTQKAGCYVPVRWVDKLCSPTILIIINTSPLVGTISPSPCLKSKQFDNVKMLFSSRALVKMKLS